MYSDKEQAMFLKLGWKESDFSIDPYVLYRMAIQDAFLNDKRGPAVKSLMIAGRWFLEKNAPQQSLQYLINLEYGYMSGCRGKEILLRDFPKDEVVVGLKLRAPSGIRKAEIINVTNEDWPYWVRYEDGYETAIDHDALFWVMLDKEKPYDY